MTRNHQNKIYIHVTPSCTLHAGWWEQLKGEDGDPYRIIHPPEQSLFEQVLSHIETLIEPSTQNVPTSLSLNDHVRALLAICLRWGSYFAVVTDTEKPVWPGAKRTANSLISDAEMARINIEASAALEQWIDIMRSDYTYYCTLVRATHHLPLSVRHIHIPPDGRERHLKWMLFSRCIRYLGTPQERAQLINAQSEETWSKTMRKAVSATPTRLLANGLINTCWRNGTSIENIHAGKANTLPLLYRRLTPQQERNLLREAGEMFMVALEVIFGLLHEQGEVNWETQVLPFALYPLLFQLPSHWSVTEKTRKVILYGEEPPSRNYSI